ncbi:hypothetical protein ACFY36_03740 [Actinoplanes sp. NPDC000266]
MRSGNWRSPGLTRIAGGLLLLAVAVWVAGVIVLAGAPAGGVSFEVGKWLLQVGTVFAGAGFVTAVLRQAEVTRAQREAWTATLQDLVVGQDALEAATMRLISDPDAQSYGELVEKCRDVRAMLRRVMALPEAYDYTSELRLQIHRMRDCLKPAIKEYERQHLRITRQGRLDEKILDGRLDKRRKDMSALFEPMGVARLLRDPKEFPDLTALLRNFNVEKIEFRPDSDLDQAYENVKALIRANAGMPDRQA